MAKREKVKKNKLPKDEADILIREKREKQSVKKVSKNMLPKKEADILIKEKRQKQGKIKEVKVKVPNKLPKEQAQIHAKEKSAKRVNKHKLPKAEAKVWAREKRIRRAFRIARLRPLKNLCFWFMGLLSSVALIAGAIFIGVGVLPISTFVSDEQASDFVSPKVTEETLLGALGNISNYTFDDLPIVRDLIGSVFGAGNGDSPLENYQKVNKLPKMTEENGSYKFTDEEGNASDYYYSVNDLTVAPASVMSTKQSTSSYKRAFDDNGVLLESLNEKYLDNSLQLYLTPLFSLPVGEGISSFSRYLNYYEVSALFEMFSGSGFEEGSLLETIFEGMYVNDLSGDGETLTDKIMKKLSLESLEIEDMGDFGEEPFFKEYEKILVADYPTTDTLTVDDVSKELITKTDGELDYEPKLYYVELKASVPATEDAEAVEGVYARAFTDDGEFITDYDLEGTKVTYENLEAVKTAEKLCYAHLKKVPMDDFFLLLDVSLDRAHLSTFLEAPTEENGQKNKMLYDILSEATGSVIEEVFVPTPADEITLSDMENFDIDKVKLSTVLSNDGGNKILKALIKNQVTIGNLGTAINELSLYEIYGEDCFTTDSTVGGDKFVKDETGGVIKYVRDNTSGTYYLNKSSGIWLILSFTVTVPSDSVDGSATSYTADTEMTMGKLQDEGDKIGERLLDARIHQLVEAGIIKRDEPLDSKVTNLTINQLIDIINNDPSIIPG